MSEISAQVSDYGDLLEFGRSIAGDGQEDEEVLAGRVQTPALRSILYVPGNRREWIQKCHRFNADAIVLDLEDSVPLAEREQARKIISEEIGPLAARVRSVWVRVNAAATSLADDLAAAVRPGIKVIQLPKVFSAKSVVDLDHRLGYFEGRSGLAFRSTVISPILETAGGIQRAYEIAMASSRIEYLGAVVAPEGDTARALRMTVMHDAIGTESLYIRGKVVVDARAAGVRHVIGGTVTDLSPKHELLRSFSSMNRAMGYSGTLLIHPDQVPVAHELFGPSAENIKEALEVLRLLRASPGRAAVRNAATGKMIDLAHGRHAYWVLYEAQAFDRSRFVGPAS
jgi:citrate lyase subunit beta/citryl-CoA lyase